MTKPNQREPDLFAALPGLLLVMLLAKSLGVSLAGSELAGIDLDDADAFPALVVPTAESQIDEEQTDDEAHISPSLPPQPSA